MTNSPSNTPLPDRVPIDMTKYPALKAMGKDAGPLVSALFTMANNVVSKGHDKVSKQYFGLEYQDLINQLSDAMFDYKGITAHLPNQSNAAALNEMFGHTLNPLHAAFTKENLMDHKGVPVTFEEKFGVSEKDYTVKRFMQGLLFYSYYCSLPDLADYLAMGEYDLIDDEKYKNIAKLLEIKPVLAYQKAIGIIPGKLYPETGFFQAGDLKDYTECPACRVPEQLFSLGDDDITVCLNCKGAYDK